MYHRLFLITVCFFLNSQSDLSEVIRSRDAQMLEDELESAKFVQQARRKKQSGETRKKEKRKEEASYGALFLGVCGVEWGSARVH